ncbi:MAG: C40 family peptidase [Gemmatimonadales bacterium]
MTVPRRPLIFCCACLLLASRVGVAAAQQPQFSASEKPFATISRMLLGQPQQDSLVDLARSAIGLRYKWGAESPGKAFDCSGLVQWLMANFNLDLPRTSREQVKAGIEVAKDTAEMQPGDLLFFGRGKRITHVGVYVGDGRFVQAANRRLGVIESPLPTGRRAATWWKSVRRLFVRDTTPPPTDNSAAIGSSS